MDINDIKKIYDKLETPPGNADKQWYQNRGRNFEKILHSILELDSLKPRTNYRPDGEEIDGSFILKGKVFLLEAKWYKKPIPASVLYNFKGKVDGKLVGTIGIFISMSNYSKKAIDALTKGKDINLILFGYKDIKAIIEKNMSFIDLLEFKLRMAAEEGTVYVETKVEEVFADKKGNIIKAPTSIESATRPDTLAFICEGETDQIIIQELLLNLISKLYSKAVIRILNAGGKYNLSKVANILKERKKYKKIFVVIDSDGNPKFADEFVRKDIKIDNYELLILKNNIEEEWLGIDYSESIELKKKVKSELFVQISSLVAKIDLDDLRKRSINFEKIMNEVEQIEKFQ